MHSVSIGVHKEDVCLHSDIEIWMQLIANGNNTDKCGRFEHISQM